MRTGAIDPGCSAVLAARVSLCWSFSTEIFSLQVLHPVLLNLMSQLSSLLQKAKRVLSPASVRKYVPRAKRAAVAPVPTPAGLRDDVLLPPAQACEAASVAPVEAPVAVKKTSGARKRAAKRGDSVDSLALQESAALQALEAQSALSAPDQSRTAPWGDVDWAEDDDEVAGDEPQAEFPPAVGGASPRLVSSPQLGMLVAACVGGARMYIGCRTGCCMLCVYCLPGRSSGGCVSP